MGKTKNIVQFKLTFLKVMIIFFFIAVSSQLYAKAKSSQVEEVDYLALCALLIKDGFYDRAEETLNSYDTSVKNADLSRYYTLSGLIYLKKNLFVEAEERFLSAVKNGQTEPVVWIYIAQARYGNRNYKGTVEAVAKAGSSADSMPAVISLTAESYWKLKETEKAVEYLKTKGVKVPAFWNNILKDAEEISRKAISDMKMAATQEVKDSLQIRDKAARKAQKHVSDLVASVKQSVIDAVATGEDRKSVVRKIRQQLKDNGFTNYPKAKIELMYESNVRQAYAAGQWKGIEESKDMMPYLQYICQMLPTSRDRHKQLNGKVYRVDDPIWQSIYPPNGYRCKCGVKQLSAGDIKRRGLTVDESNGKPPAPGTVDKGWDTNPGMTAWEPEIIKYDKDIRDKAIRHEYEYFQKNRLHISKQTVGVVDDDVAEYLKKKGVVPASRNIVLKSDQLKPIKRDSKADRSAVIPEEHQDNLPDFISDPDAVYWHDGSIVYVRKSGSKLSKLVVKTDNKKQNSVRMADIVRGSAISEKNGYEKIR